MKGGGKLEIGLISIFNPKPAELNIYMNTVILRGKVTVEVGSGGI